MNTASVRCRVARVSQLEAREARAAKPAGFLGSISTPACFDLDEHGDSARVYVIAMV